MSTKLTKKIGGWGHILDLRGCEGRGGERKGGGLNNVKDIIMRLWVFVLYRRIEVL